MVQVRDIFGQPLPVKRSRVPDPPATPERRSRFRNPEGGGEPDADPVRESRVSRPSDNRQGREPFSVSDRQGKEILRLMELSTNHFMEKQKDEIEFIARRIAKISKSGVLEILPEFLKNHKNYHPVQAIDHLDGYKESF